MMIFFLAATVGSISWWLTGWLASPGSPIVSLIDDRRGLPIAVRFGVQLLAATFLVIGSGLALPPTAVPMLGLIKLGWLTAPFTVLFFVWMANLYNFMDGMDGFAGGMTVIGCGLLGSLGWQPPFSQVPLWAMSLGGQCGYILQALLRKPVPLSSATSEKLIGDMSFQPRCAFEAAVPELIQHYRRSLS